MGTNTSDVEVRSQRVGTSVIDSSNDVELSSGSHVRIQTTRRTEMIPQLDGPISMYSRERILEDARTEQELNQRTAISQRREYPDESSDDSHSDRRTCNDRMPPKRKRYYAGNGRLPDRGND